MKYQLHDSQINGLSIFDNKITFSFSQGFWETDENGKEIMQLQNCKLIFNVKNNGCIPTEEFISVRISKKKNVFKSVCLSKFLGLLQKSPFDVDMEYDCLFSNRKMLQMYSNALKMRAEIFIEEIENIEYIHDTKN